MPAIIWLITAAFLASGEGAWAAQTEEEVRQAETEARYWAEQLQRRINALGKSVPGSEPFPKGASPGISLPEPKGDLPESPAVVEAAPTPVSTPLKRKAVSARELRKDVYLIRVRDELDISITGPAEASRKVPVNDDGTITFPLIGTFPVVGRSLQQVENDLRIRLNRVYLPTQDSQKKPPPSPKVPRKTISPAEARGGVYTLQVGDQLDVSVWGHTDLSRQAQIRGDGSISFPLIGDLAAEGRTVKEVEKEVQARLERDYIVNPQVTVRLSGAKFTVLGEVARPGSYSMEGPLDLLTVISQAGGTTKSGLSRVEIIRERKNLHLTIVANLELILQGKEPNVNIMPRDTIYVMGLPSEGLQVRVRLSGAKFSVLGDVERPGSFPLEGTTDLLTAISEAGGLTKFGSSRVEIVREKGDTKYTIRTNLDRILRWKDSNVEILPRDTIYVRRRLF